jgi:hypothetical protein
MASQEQTIQEQTIQEQIVDETSQEIVQYEAPTSLEIIPGFSVSSNMSFSEKKTMLKLVTEIIGRPSEKIDDYLNTPIPCLGVVMHPCMVRAKKETIDPETGEVGFPLLPATRIVFLRADSEKSLAFVATSVERFVRDMVLPYFGAGPWEEPIIFKFRQVTPSSGGRAFNTTIVG